MERPLYAPSVKPQISDVALESGDAAIDASALYTQIVVDKARLTGNIRHALRARSQVNLAELCRLRLLRHGLAELVAYLQLASDDFNAVVNEEVVDTVAWSGPGQPDWSKPCTRKFPVLSIWHDRCTN